MHKQLTLSNFRGFKNFSMDLAPVTLIAGRNNTGKTSVLEAIFMLYRYGHTETLRNLPMIRGYVPTNFSAQNLWELLFYEMNPNNVLKVSLDDMLIMELQKNDNVAQTRTTMENVLNQFGNTGLSITSYLLGCKFTDKGIVSEFDYFVDGEVGNQGINAVGRNSANIPYSSKDYRSANYFGPNVLTADMEVANWFEKLSLNNRKKDLVKFLQIIDSDIVEIENLGAVPQFYITNKAGTKLPLVVMGDGIRKVMHVASYLFAGIEKPLLLDEVENGLHHSLHAKFWELISALAKQENRQIIATTHSDECIEGALDGVKAAGLQDRFAYVRLDRTDDGQVVAKKFDAEKLERFLEKDREVR
ncbi:MAG: ATP-binding protein [Defluviitaleaceae bacterium]|nr:ATP-binding protein [Defluviitaleaceae bacterium]